MAMAISPRKKQVKQPTSLPKDFVNSVVKLFNQQSGKQKKEADFLVYADLYMNEVVLCVSLTHPKSLRAATIYLSMDLTKDISEKPELVTEKLKVMVDVAASWFAQSLEAGKGLDSVLEAMKDAPNLWETFTWEKEELFVKLNRDNHALENAANKFLKASGFDPDDMDDEELEKELEEALAEVEGDDEIDPRRLN